MLYLIQGLFFQSEEERASLAKIDLRKSTYQGIIFTDPTDESQLTGKMFDFYGKAELFDISISEQVLLFTKQYGSDNGYLVLRYQFKRQDNFYVGECIECMELRPDRGNDEKRATKCVLTEVPDDFFIDPK